jgi:hypothetical protein
MMSSVNARLEPASKHMVPQVTQRVKMCGGGELLYAVFPESRSTALACITAQGLHRKKVGLPQLLSSFSFFLHSPPPLPFRHPFLAAGLRTSSARLHFDL